MCHLKPFSKFILLVLLLSSKESIQAQVHRCGTVAYQDQLILKDPALLDRIHLGAAKVQQFLQHPEFNKTNSVTTVPIVVHLLYNNASPAQNLSDAQINSQITVLNEDYSRKNADTSQTPTVWKKTASATSFQFVLAKRDPKGVLTNGIIRKATTNTSFLFNSDDERFSARGGDDAWNSDQYLNIWVVPAISNAGGSEVLGFCTPAGTDKTLDGITVGYKYFGRNSNSQFYNLGRTVTHEVGHWFGLLHVWGTNDNFSCNSSDSISDTPTQTMASSGKPNFPVTDTCSRTYPGIMFMNYMDYADDVAMNLFTTEQVARMNAVLNTYRSSIKSSLGGLAGISTNNVQPFLEVFPNPTKGNLTLRSDLTGFAHADLSIYSVFGHLIRKETIVNDITFLNLSEESDGYYLLKFDLGNQSFYKKIIVAKE